MRAKKPNSPHFEEVTRIGNAIVFPDKSWWYECDVEVEVKIIKF